MKNFIDYAKMREEEFTKVKQYDNDLMTYVALREYYDDWVKLNLHIVNSTFTEYEKQVSVNCIELIAQNKDKYILDNGILYLVELVEKYTVVPINQP